MNCVFVRFICLDRTHRSAFLRIFLGLIFIATTAAAQTAVDVPRQEEKDRARRKAAKEQEKQAQRASSIEFRGQAAFDEKTLRSELKEQITTIEQFGLSAPRGDDAAFFLELFYRKHGYAKAEVRYRIESGDRLLLDIKEGPLVTLGLVNFVGNRSQPPDVLFDYAVGPTRERYSKLQKRLPFVTSDIEEGAELVHRLYVSQGFLDAKVDPPIYHYADSAPYVDVTIPITEGRQYFFGDLRFAGSTIYGPDALRGQMLDTTTITGVLSGTRILRGESGRARRSVSRSSRQSASSRYNYTRSALSF
jgi:outer membrane protein assembly factor BamA